VEVDGGGELRWGGVDLQLVPSLESIVKV